MKENLEDEVVERLDTLNSQSVEHKDELKYELMSVKPLLYSWLIKQLFLYLNTKEDKFTLGNDFIIVDNEEYPNKLLVTAKVKEKLTFYYGNCFYDVPLKKHISLQKYITSLNIYKKNKALKNIGNKTISKCNVIKFIANGNKYRVIQVNYEKNRCMIQKFSGKSSRAFMQVPLESVQFISSS